MHNVCERCGMWTAEPQVDPAGPEAICAHCGHRHRFRMLPLHIVTGPSGAGKTTICASLAGTLDDVVCLESDVLWGGLAATPEDDYRGYWDYWLRLAAAISQAGRPVALFGTTLPERIEPSPNRRYFSAVRYLALVCDDAGLERRLRARPAWRGCDEVFIAGALAYNRRLKAEAAAGALYEELLDITGLSVAQAAGCVAAWLKRAPQEE